MQDDESPEGNDVSHVCFTKFLQFLQLHSYNYRALENEIIMLVWNTSLWETPTNILLF